MQAGVRRQDVELAACFERRTPQVHLLLSISRIGDAEFCQSILVEVSALFSGDGEWGLKAGPGRVQISHH